MKTIAPLIAVHQADLFGDCPVTDAVLALANAGAEQRGAVFTKQEVVDFILDLAGYTTDRPLMELRLLEPSFGKGDFRLFGEDGGRDGAGKDEAGQSTV